MAYPQIQSNLQDGVQMKENETLREQAVINIPHVGPPYWGFPNLPKEVRGEVAVMRCHGDGVR